MRYSLFSLITFPTHTQLQKWSCPLLDLHSNFSVCFDCLYHLHFKKDIGDQNTKDNDPWETKNKHCEPTDCHVLLPSVSREWPREPSGLSDLRRGSWKSEDTRVAQVTREEEAAHIEFWGSSLGPLSVFTWVLISTYKCRSYPSPEKEPPEWIVTRTILRADTEQGVVPHVRVEISEFTEY